MIDPSIPRESRPCWEITVSLEDDSPPHFTFRCRHCTGNASDPNSLYCTVYRDKVPNARWKNRINPDHSRNYGLISIPIIDTCPCNETIEEYILQNSSDGKYILSCYPKEEADQIVSILSSKLLYSYSLCRIEQFLQCFTLIASTFEPVKNFPEWILLISYLIDKFGSNAQNHVNGILESRDEMIRWGLVVRS